MLEGLQAGIASQLAVLDDADRTGTGQSAAAILGVSAAVLAEKLTGYLVREIMFRGSGGGPLTPLADQLNHDLTHLQGQRVEGMLAQLAALAITASAPSAGAGTGGVAAATRTLPRDIASFTGRRQELQELVDAAAGAVGVMSIHAIGGMAGVGKTAFAVHLPLAIGMVARQLHHHPAWSLAGRAAELAAAVDRLELMATENLSVAAAFNMSYVELAPDQQRLFRRLGLHPGPDIDGYAGAALDGTDLGAWAGALLLPTAPPRQKTGCGRRWRSFSGSGRPRRPAWPLS